MATSPQALALYDGALLASERYRVLGFIAMLMILLGLVIVRGVIDEDLLMGGTLYTLAIVGFFVGYECLLLLLIARAKAGRVRVPRVVWTLNVLVECSMPTVAIITSVQLGYSGAYDALTTPAVLVYGLVIMLSTLRLSPALAMLSGVACAMGHVSALVWIYSTYGPPDAERDMRLAVYGTYGAIILIGGFAASLLASRIRAQVRAAIAEGENRRRFERDLEIARTIQQGLLPDEPPRVPGYDIAGFSDPADQTGGDYYDALTLDDGRVAISLGDVTGHGIGPALIASVCRAYVRAGLAGSTDLESVFESVNSALAADLPDDRFVTFAAALIEPETGAVELLSAGHGPMLHYRAADGSIETYRASGVPFAVVPSDAGFGPPERFALAPGDCFVTMTDGFFEWARADGEQFGIERLARCVREDHESAASLIEHMRRAVLDFASGTPQGDDLTAVAIVRQPA